MRKIDKCAMAKGYMKMARINLTISAEDFHLESEGANLGYDKMVGEKGENKA